MANADLARIFERIADLLEIDGADGFRVNSYRRAARTLKDTPHDAAQLASEDRLTELPGIGKGTADRIRQFLSTGKINVLSELEARIPPGLHELLAIPSLGPKKISLAHKELHVCNLEDLKRVIASGEFAALRGMGATSVGKIAEGIKFLESTGGRTPLGIAMHLAEAILERVRALPGVRQVAIAGSLRRGLETIGDIDILCDAADGETVVRRFVGFDGVQRVLAAGPTKGSVVIKLDPQHEVQVDLRVVPTESFGAALQYFTGSKEHNVRLREMAVRRKWRLNEYGLSDGSSMIAGKTEADIYRALGLPCIPPELREDRGECEPGFEINLDDLIELKHVRGDLHMHTVASDGKNTIEEMALAAKALGYSYIAICDHSKSSVIANGLSIERMHQHLADIRAANDRLEGISILAGCECDVLPDGSLDFPDDLLAQCDWVVASLHAAMGSGGSGKTSPTERTLAAIENRYVTVIGHPTGRLINRRAPMDLDMAAVVAAAARTGTMLEINASWQRLDLKDLHVSQALAAGVTLAINTDAHRTDQLQLMRYGVITARRGGASRKNVANCTSLTALRRLIAKKRGRA